MKYLEKQFVEAQSQLNDIVSPIEANMQSAVRWINLSFYSSIIMRGRINEICVESTRFPF